MNKTKNHTSDKVYNYNYKMLVIKRQFTSFLSAKKINLDLTYLLINQLTFVVISIKTMLINSKF